MLTLSRNLNKPLFIQPFDDLNPALTVAELFTDDPIEIRVTEIRSDRIKISIQAPAELDIAREELVARLFMKRHEVYKSYGNHPEN